MDSDKGHVQLIEPKDQIDDSGMQFPVIKQIINPLQKYIVDKNITYPQIFSLGGQTELNRVLYRLRQHKGQIMSSRKPNIECCDLGKQYNLKGENPVVALKSVTLNDSGVYGTIKQGEFVMIRGPSGGGKTTFLNLLGTIDSFTKGSLKIQGITIDSKSKDQQLSRLRRERIGIVFQTFNLLALMSAYENIELPMRIRGILSEKQMKERTKMLLKRVGLSERADHLPSQLSGGEQQRVAIARSLANSPAIILLDEPTGDLDSKATVKIMNLLLQVNNFGYEHCNINEAPLDPITIIMVTHNQDLKCYGDRIIFFEDGKIKRQVLNSYQFALNADEYSQFLNTKV